MPDIISFGAATVDIFAKSDHFRVKDKNLFLEYSSKNEIDHSLICSGGGATNSSTAFSRLGLNAAIISLLGRDSLSHIITQELIQNKVDSKLLISKKDESTDFSIILVAPDGGRSILTHRGSSRLEAVDIPWEKIKKTKWLYITSLEGNLDLLEQLIGFAKENNIKISLNPGNREISSRKILLPLLSQVDFLLLNKVESEALTLADFGQTDYWQKLKKTGSKIIAVTNGRRGAHILTSEDNLFSPIINTHPIDETGAGDSFGSAFVAALCYDYSVKKALSWAIKNSASVVSFMGAKEGLLTLNKIKR
jgi:sugar/nucleoside kinase (ribokinase family)